MVESVHLEFLGLWTFPFGWWLEREGNLGADKPVVCVAVCTGHYPGVQDISGVSLANYDVVQNVPMLRTRVAPGRLKAFMLLEQGVGDGQLVFRTELQQQAPIVIAVPMTVSSKNSLPQLRVSANSGIEIAKDDQFNLGVGACDEAV